MKSGVLVEASSTPKPPLTGKSNSALLDSDGSKTAMRRPSGEKPAMRLRGSVLIGPSGLAAEAGASRSQRESVATVSVGEGETATLLRRISRRWPVGAVAISWQAP